jgi:tetratricopeptide (TPR) repeat protein
MRLLVLASFVVASPAFAQSIDESLKLYKDQKYADAALSLYDVMSHHANADTRDQATIYLAETLRKMQLWSAASVYYEVVFGAGRQNRYYLNAVEGILQIQRRWEDPIFAPVMVNNQLDPDGFGQLDPERIAQVNYLIGELAYRRGQLQDAKAFLEYVPAESSYHFKARYMLALVATRLQGGGNEAFEHFKYIVDMIPESTTEPERVRMRNLALVGAARAAYGEGRYLQSAEFYGEVPRFSEHWFTALYESAWAWFQAKRYGRALGQVQSVRAPYFGPRHVPESYVIAATSYIANCQWDRVRREVATYKEVYEPMLPQISAYLAADRPAPQYYKDVTGTGDAGLPLELAREVRRKKRFKDYHFMLEHMTWEMEFAQKEPTWSGSRLGNDVVEFARLRHEELLGVVGAWAKQQLTFLTSMLQNYHNQIQLLDFEVTDAERRWLEQGQEILKGRRARLPRPEIPSDQWQHWSFDREYWKDELGYFQHSIASECLDGEG